MSRRARRAGAAARGRIPGSLRKPRPTAGQTHRDAPLSRRGRLIWWSLLGVLVAAAIALLLIPR
jgi:hypothetical protein